MDSHGLNQARLAESLEVSDSTVSKWLSTHRPSVPGRRVLSSLRKMFPTFSDRLQLEWDRFRNPALAEKAATAAEDAQRNLREHVAAGIEFLRDQALEALRYQEAQAYKDWVDRQLVDDRDWRLSPTEFESLRHQRRKELRPAYEKSHHGHVFRATGLRLRATGDELARKVRSGEVQPTATEVEDWVSGMRKRMRSWYGFDEDGREEATKRFDEMFASMRSAVAAANDTAAAAQARAAELEAQLAAAQGENASPELIEHLAANRLATAPLTKLSAALLHLSQLGVPGLSDEASKLQAKLIAGTQWDSNAGRQLRAKRTTMAKRLEALVELVQELSGEVQRLGALPGRGAAAPAAPALPEDARAALVDITRRLEASEAEVPGSAAAKLAALRTLL